MAAKAAAPPPRLSEETCETANGGIVDRGVDQDDLDTGERLPCQGRLHRLDVGRGDQDGVRLRQHDRVQDRLSAGSGRTLSRPWVFTVTPELLGLVLDAALHGDVEVVTRDTLDERDLVILAGLTAGPAAPPEEPALETRRPTMPPMNPGRRGGCRRRTRSCRRRPPPMNQELPPTMPPELRPHSGRVRGL